MFKYTMSLLALMVGRREIAVLSEPHHFDINQFVLLQGRQRAPPGFEGNVAGSPTSSDLQASLAASFAL